MFNLKKMIALMLIMILIESSKASPQSQSAAFYDQKSFNSLRKEKQQQNYLSMKEDLFKTNRNSFTSSPAITFNHWDKDGNLITSENEIPSSSNKRESININPHRSQSDYACGRAIANKKYKDLLIRDQAYQMSVSRMKYRPIEIRMPRIIGGDETAPGEFPWTVSVKLNDQPICGGSLIDKSWILTAAHCVVGYNPKNLTVRLGAYRIKDTSETQTIDLPVSMFIVHKEYSMPRPFSNDIALVKLNEPVELTDYIIPICLPTEDQVSTTVLSSLNNNNNNNIVVDDYSNKRLDFIDDNNNNNRADDESGIVISTKMSDHDIAKCFNRLEQNYLNSIGLGAIAEATTELSAPPQKAPIRAQSQEGVVASLSPVQFIDKNHRYQSQSSAAAGAVNNKYNNNNNKGETFLDNNNNNNKVTYITHPSESEQIQYQKQQQQQQQQQLERPFKYKPSVGNYDEVPISIDLNSLNQVTNNAGFSSISFSGNNLNSDSNDGKNKNNYIYYGLPWDGEGRRKNLYSQTAGVSKSENSFNDDFRRDNNNNNKIKLSRLPISKELLREIQSVGSGSMPSLHLGLEQGDFVAMASDLTKPHSISGSADSSGSSTVSTIPTTATLLAGANGETIVDLVSNNRNNILASFSNKHLIRTAMDVEDNDDPTKYSGLSGIVVGWGWVREIDGDDSNINNKGYPSVTLQKVKLPILRNNVCEAWFQSQSKKITLLPSQFCAGFNSGGKDACRGDSGGPMIIEDNSDTGRYKLIGIVSAGIGCARPSLPGLYTRVASFIPWINAQLLRY